MSIKQFSIYKLHFTSPLHIGDSREDYGISQKTMNSDAMYAALTSCLAKMGYCIPDNGDLGCTISSLFPFYQMDGQSSSVLFFPKPLGVDQSQLGGNVSDIKKLKKIAWRDLPHFEKAINGECLIDEGKQSQVIQGIYLTNDELDKDFVSSQVSQRVMVSRDHSEDALPFYMDRIFFKDYSGLFFLAMGDTSLLDKAMELLRTEGIGTDRNVGNGFFEYETEKIELRIPENASKSLSLSMFIPSSKEQLSIMLNSSDVAYDFQRRGGWITTPPHTTIRKNAIYAFGAGSVFAKLNDDIITEGSIVDLRPSKVDINHPIWRCGRSIFIPTK